MLAQGQLHWASGWAGTYKEKLPELSELRRDFFGALLYLKQLENQREYLIYSVAVIGPVVLHIEGLPR